MSFSFGTPASAPAAGGLSGGFSFGANKPATPGFGLTATSQPSTGLFGSTATSSAPAFGASSGFGSTATPAFGAAATPSFGATSSAPAYGTGTTPGFGAASAAPAFGANTTPAFGATSAPTFGATSAAPSFGATPAPTFGATAAAPAFGATSAAPTFGATSTAPAFGTTTPAFGATSAAPTFGATTTPAFGQTTTPGFGLGTGGLNFGGGSSTSAANTGLTLGAPASSNTGLGGLGGFGLGTSTQSTGLGGGLFASTASTASTGLYDMFPHGSPMIPITQTFQMLPHTPTQHPMNPGNLSEPAYELRSPKRECYKTITPSSGAKLGTTSVTGTQPSASAAPSLGLGGVAPVGTTNTTTSGDGKTEPPKQIKLPNEISTTVDSFKDFIKKQKSLSSEIMRVSIKPLHKVAREAEVTLRLALSLQGEVGRARAHSRRLRASAAAALATAETLSSYPPTELEGNAPPEYVKELISELEQQLIAFRRQMDVADKHMQASPKLLTEQELTLGIRRMHESLVALAGRLQAVHAQVEDQKEQYLNLRKYVLKDPTNVFDTPDPSSTLDQILRDAEGTRKKTKTNLNVSNYGSAVLTDPRAVLGNIQQLAGPTPFTYVSTTLSPFPNQDTTGGSWQPPAAPPATNFGSSFASYSAAPADSFQLQKPPGKRGKQ